MPLMPTDRSEKGRCWLAAGTVSRESPCLTTRELLPCHGNLVPLCMRGGASAYMSVSSRFSRKQVSTRL